MDVNKEETTKHNEICDDMQCSYICTGKIIDLDLPNVDPDHWKPLHVGFMYSKVIKFIIGK